MALRANFRWDHEPQMSQRRNPKSGLFRLLDISRQPIYALDEQRRIAYANPATADWLGIPLDRLLGMACNYHSRSDADLPQRIAASLCPPPEAFTGSACASDVGGYVRRVETGESQPGRPAQFFPVAGEQDSYAVIAVVIDSSAIPIPEANQATPQTVDENWHSKLLQWRREFSAIYRLDRIMGVSESMRAAQRVAKAAIASGADTVVVGPPGGGMEQLARAIHYSQFTAGSAPPLIPLDCTIGDAESFQDALRQVQSDREQTAKGRILLLRADQMESRLMAEMAGFVAFPNFDIGFLTTSESSLRGMADQGQFDPALAQHLSTLEIQLPKLSQRMQDLPLICQALIEDFNAEGNHQLTGIQHEALDMLCQYPWPRNIDELAQVIHAACQSATPPLIRTSDLPKQIQQAIGASRFPPPMDGVIELPSFLKEIEDEIIQRAIRAAKGNKAKAARMLGVSRQRVIRWSEQKSSD